MKSISGKRMCKVLEARGWTLDRIRGSHHIYRHQGQSISVPVHSNHDLPAGTQRAIMRQANLNETDL